jgi:phosphoserine aminotransferase
MLTRTSDFTSNELNFSAGPGALPEPVLREAQDAIVALPETGVSVLGMSHRSEWFESILAESEANLRALLGIPRRYAVLFLQGGSSLQFSMIPMNFAKAGRCAAYVKSGYWSAKAIEEARCVAPLEVAWDGSADHYRTLPNPGQITIRDDAPYAHYVSNETIEGLQFRQGPSFASVPWIVDMSSDFLSKPVNVEDHAMIYAHAQKNVGPAGVTICVIDRELLRSIPAGLPPMLDYRTHVAHHSNYNTPPVFGIYVLTLVTRWLRSGIGGLSTMAAINRSKAATMYRTLDQLTDLIDPHADPAFRSTMNATFRFRDERLDSMFLAAANEEGFQGLAGHRSIGGIRASMYNAVSERAVDHLSEFLRQFCGAHA